MRPFLFLIICAVVVVIVASVIIFSPEPAKTKIAVHLVDLNRQPQPVIQSDPAGSNILNFFPDPSEALPFQQEGDVETTETEAAPTPAESSGDANQALASKELDRNRLLALIDDWIYTEYKQVGATKIGTIQQTRSNVYLSIFEGRELENGIFVASLNSDAATLNLGEASFTLHRAQEPTFFVEVKQTLRPLTPDEQQQAYDYYMRVYGEKFKAWSEGYKPPNGMPMPQPITDEQKAKGLEEYWNRYGNQFHRENTQFKAPFFYGEKQRGEFDKYWDKFHPGVPKPAFEQIFGNANPLGPGARISPTAPPGTP